MALDNFRAQKIIWDRANKKIFEKIEANSGDSNGRKLVVQVINQEATEVLSGTTLSLGWKSREGGKGLDAFRVVDSSKGIFEIYYTTEMLSNIGNIEASLILIDSTSRIESSTFTISVRPSTVDDESVESENSFTALTEALVKVNDLEGNYAPRLNEVTKQLAQTERVLKNNIIKRLSKSKVDPLGFKSINIIGDSISHGANAPYIYHDAWTAIFRNAMQLSFETDNYGFVNIMPPMSNTQGTYTDQIYTSTNWTRENTTDTPGFFQLKSSIPDQYIRLSVQDKKYQVNKVGVAVKKTTQGGEVNIKVLSSTFSVVNEKTISLQSTNQQDIIWLDTDNSSDVHRVDITNLSGTNILTGVYLMDDMDNIVVNNYSRSGARIEDLSDSLIDKLFNTNVVVFALGHNSNPTNIDSYLEKCRVAYETYKPYVYVVDFTWTNARKLTGQKLEKFASDVNGEYIEIIERVENAKELIESGFLSDVSHPSVEGHRVIGESVLVAVKSPVTSKALINNFYNAQSTIPIEKTITPASQYTLNPSSWVKTNRLNVVTLDISGEIKSGDVITTIDPSLQSLNLIGYAWGTDEGLISCPFTINGSTGALTVYPPRALIGNRFTASFSYISKT